MNEETIFAAALELESAERANYLAKACGGNSTLRKRLEGLLAASDRAGNFMARPAVASAERANAVTEIVDGESTPHDVTVTRDESTPLSEEQSEAVSFLSPSTRPDSLGRIGHYEVLQILGKGGFGIVFRAFDDTLQRVVAIKAMAPQLAATSPARKRFLREARTSAQVRHENVVQVYEVAELPLPYLAMEFIPGETLQERLNRTGPLDVPETLRIGRQIAEGLAAAHATDVIHRDIKPSNVLIEGGPQQRVKITDFGLARAADDASISQSGIIAGTPMYMAPEQALGHKLDQRADLFSLGSVLYQMVAGRAPFRANGTVAVLKRVAEDTPRAIREIIPETPQWLCNIIAKLHEKKPEDRYQSAREIADVLADCEQQLKAHGTLKDYSRIPGGNPQRRRIGRKWKRAAAAVVLLLAVTVGAYAGPFALRYAFDAGKVTFLNAGYPGDKLLVRRDGQIVATLDSANSSAHLASGEYELEAVCAEGEEVSSVIAGTRRLFEGGPGRGADGPVLKLTIRRGDAIRVGFAVKDKVPPPSPPEGWVRLFNGKDLTGWKPNANWTVLEGGVLSSLALGQKWDPDNSGLMSARDDFENFHLRVEARINDRGNSGIWFRRPGTEYQPDFYEAEINSTGASGSRTGTLAHAGPDNADKADKAPPPAPNEWFTMEVIAIDKELIVKVNGRETAHWVDPAWTYKKGAFELQQLDENTIVQFRKIEIKELPASSLPPTFTDADAQRIRALLAAEQVEEVRKELMRFNPGFDGAIEHKIEGGVVTELRIVTDEVTDIAPIRVFNALRVLDLSGTESEGQVNGQLADLTPLKGVNLSSLTKLSLNNSKIDDAALVHFKDCKNLTGLWLNRSKVTNAGMACFKECKNLHTLGLKFTEVYDAGLVHFKDCKDLTGLDLGELPVTDQGLANFKDCKGLTELWLNRTQVTDAGLVHFKDCKNLAILHLGGTQMNDAGLAHLAGCKKLNTVWLDGTQITDAGLVHLAGLDELTNLILVNTKVTAKAIEELAKALPKCKIEWDGGVIEPK
jgi:serine/threonine protein kinase/Leucine-rich repeat (LRR) protein